MSTLPESVQRDIDAFRAYSRTGKIREHLLSLAQYIGSKYTEDALTLNGHDMYDFMWKDESDEMWDIYKKAKSKVDLING